MKLFLSLFLTIPLVVLAQSPISTQLNLYLNHPVISFDKPVGLDQIVKSERLNGESFKFAEMISTDIDIEHSGFWTIVDGGKIWSVGIKADQAKAISLYMDKFWIPSGGELYVYNLDKSQVAGPFTSKDNHESGVYAIQLLAGEEIVVEYYQAESEESNPQLRINEFAYAYRNVGGLWGYGGSDNCQVNANCSEGDAWQNQKTSACRIQIGNGVCSGALINNTSGDCKALVLSADHCFSGGNISENQLNQVIFYFNYESNGCNNSMPNYDAITGCELLANSGGEGGNGDSDFFLVELNNEPDFNPYFSGWDRTNSASPFGVSFHHPSGDIKKYQPTINHLLHQEDWGLVMIIQHIGKYIGLQPQMDTELLKEAHQARLFIIKMA
jgi:hypothetical protein